jgi:hypothetical protein
METGRGSVNFNTRHCPFNATTPSIHFGFTADGTFYSRTENPMQPAETFFCDKMVEGFIRQLLPSDITPRYDLDNRIAHPVMPPIVSATIQARWAGQSILSDYDTYTKATMTTTSLAIGYDKLKALDQLRHDLEYGRIYGFGIYPQPRIVELNFRAFKPLQLKEVRIDAIALINSTFSYPNQTDICVKIISGEADGATYNHTEFKLINVRNTVQDSLDRIRGDSEGFQAPCPDLWIDGTGEPYEAIVEA